jgi:hypothetical protein
MGNGLKILGIVIVIALVSIFLVPPSIRCKLEFWNRNACANVQQGAQLFNQLTGSELNPDMPNITQLDELAEGFDNMSMSDKP